MNEKGQKIRSLCAYPVGVPIFDLMLAQKIALETDEAAFLLTANHNPMAPQEAYAPQPPLGAPPVPGAHWRDLFEGRYIGPNPAALNEQFALNEQAVRMQEYERGRIRRERDRAIRNLREPVRIPEHYAYPDVVDPIFERQNHLQRQHLERMQNELRAEIDRQCQDFLVRGNEVALPQPPLAE